MPFLKYCAALWIAILFYVFSSFFVGSVGTLAYSQLERERQKQVDNIGRLNALYETLLVEKQAWESDRDTIAVHARELGYGAGDERFIRIVGRTDAPKDALDAGEVYLAGEPRAASNKTLLILSVIMFVLMELCIIVVDVLRYIKNA
ncbi:MAG: septum formation initiator family protein [Spirochaetaceae bacterium]|jgi:cell division protein FtsB|nr:septum formation initiator family protein [Spirochaetaceae bacterium]